MVESWITHDDIIKELPKLSNYISEYQVDYNEIIGNAKKRLDDMVINQGLNPRLLCTRLPLRDAQLSSEDKARRTRLVVEITSITDEAVFTFTGQDASNDTPATIHTVTAVETGILTKAFSEMFKKYTLTKSGTCEYSAYLVERSFELPHLYLSIHMIFKNLTELGGDKYQEEAIEYEERFLKAFHETNYSVDVDDDSDIDETDEVDRFNSTGIML